MPITSTHREKKSSLWAWAFYDWANSGFATVVLTAVFPVYFLAQVPEGGFTLFHRQIDGPALWGYLVSLGMITVAVLAPFLGRQADQGRYRHRLLVLCGVVGALATCAMALPPSMGLWPLIGLFWLANLGFSGGNLFYNALLPLICPPQAIDRWSSRGFAVGYIGGGLVLLGGFILIQWHGQLGLADSGSASRLLFFCTGLWWLLFALPCYLKIDEPVVQPSASDKNYFWQVFTDLRHHPNALLFLIAFLCYSDGIWTLITVSSVFASEELQLPQASILGCYLMIQFLAMPGTLLCERLSRIVGVRAVILAALALFTGITLYARQMETAQQFWILGALVALALGGSQALSRSLFARLIPPEKSAEFFGFYTVCGKFASILGPLTFALFADLTGNTRNAVVTLSFFFVVGGLLLLRVKIPPVVHQNA